MTILTILEFPDPRLRTVATALEKVNAGTRKLIDNLFATMYESKGIGLAATQVDIHKRIIVMDLQEDEKKTPLVFINPKITPLDESLEPHQEGCLSVPGFYETVKRFSRVKVNALDRQGNPFEMDCEGLLAVCIQHEVDHLDGKLFVDYLSLFKRNRIKKKISQNNK